MVRSIFHQSQSKNVSEAVDNVDTEKTESAKSGMWSKALLGPRSHKKIDTPILL